MNEEALLAIANEIVEEIESLFDRLQCRWYPATPVGIMQINCYLVDSKDREMGYCHQIALSQAIELMKVLGRRGWVMHQAKVIHLAFLNRGATLQLTLDQDEC